jgi:hypothetical protein
VNEFQLFLDLVLQLLVVRILALNLGSFILNLSLEAFDLAFDVLNTIECDLQLCFRLQTHVLDLSLIVLVLRFNVVNLHLRVYLYLVDDLLVVLLDVVDFTVQMLNLCVLDLHLFPVLVFSCCFLA